MNEPHAQHKNQVTRNSKVCLMFLHSMRGWPGVAAAPGKFGNYPNLNITPGPDSH